MRKGALLVILALSSCLLVFPQAYKGKVRIFGYVQDETGNPLGGVRVKLFSLKVNDGFEMVTDKKGKWVASWIISGDWNIDFEKMGYKIKKISVLVQEFAKNPTIEVKLEKSEELVVGKELEEELEKGNKLFAEAKYDEARMVYEKMVEANPDVYIINTNIGNCYFQQEKYEKAEEYYKRVYEKDPNNLNIILAIGNCCTNRGENETALEWYRKVEIDKIKDATVLYNIGTSLFNSSQFEEALKYYRKAVEVKGDFLDAVFQLGLSCLNLGQFEDSINTFESYLKLDPDSERAGQVRGFIEYLKKRIAGE